MERQGKETEMEMALSLLQITKTEQQFHQFQFHPRQVLVRHKRMDLFNHLNSLKLMDIKNQNLNQLRDQSRMDSKLMDKERQTDSNNK